jgi:signal transduction histidine kinase
MKFKGRLSASLVLVLSLTGTLALFFYAGQFKKDNVQSLQAKVQEMEMQRLEDEKGKQAAQVAVEMADNFKKIVEQIQKKAEATADAGSLRQPHNKPALRQNKERAFLLLVKGEPTWLNASLADETGALIASTSSATPRMLGGTPEFKEASKQRMTALRLQERKGRELVLQITVPCLTDLGEFLGIFQAEVGLTPAILARLPKKTGVFILLGTPTGRRLSDITLENFPNNLGALMGKNLQEMENFIAQTQTSYFKADWAGIHYLIGSAQTSIPGLMIFSLLEVSSLQKLIVSQAGTDSFLKDPVIVGGLIVILVVGLLITVFLSGSSGHGDTGGNAKQLEQALSETVHAGIPWTPIQGPEEGVWGEIRELVNSLIRQFNQEISKASVMKVDNQAVERLNRELEKLNLERNRLETQNRELDNRLETLTSQNQQMGAAAIAAANAAKEEKVSSWPWAEASQIRIEAIVNMSDDLKATLTVIKNYISSILASEEGKITDTQQEFLGVVINKSARLERQINDFLDFSHLETEASQMFLIPTDVVAMLQDVIFNVQPQADTKQIRLVQDISTHLPKIMLNSDRLGQVFINLVQHALRVTPVGGEVRCSVMQVGNEVVVKIADGGASLTPEQAEQVFINFHGQDSRVGQLITGTGLRFPIMKGIIDAHRGTILVRGLGDKGNEMVIKLPIAAEEKVAESEPGVVPEAAAPMAGESAEGMAPEGDKFFDLSSFMESKISGGGENTAVPGADDNLDDLLRNIENLDEKTDS